MHEKKALDSLAKVKYDGFKDKDGSRRTEDGERLSRTEPVSDTDDESGDEGLDGGHPVVGGVPQEAAERDDGSQTREVNENDGGHALQGHPVLEVRPVPRLFSF